MKHIFRREHTGEGLMGKIIPTCSCGWRGRTEYAHNDSQFTNLTEQEKEHKKNTKPSPSR